MTSENLKKESSGFGSMSHLVKDNVYLIGCSGFVYTAPWIDTRDTRPPSAAIILSVGDAPFTLSIKGRKMRAYAALVPPFIARSLHARSVPLVCFHVMPSSPRYDALKNMAQGNVAPLDRALFGRLDGELEQLYHGQLPTGRTRDVYEAVLRIPFQNRTRPGQPDPRVRHIRELLEAGPDLSLTQLAHELGTSYFWASRIMTEVFGMSLRDYKSWRKMQHVFHLLHSKRSITEIAHAAGFTDSAHLSRTYQRWFGQPPSYSRNGHHVRVLRCW